MALTLTFLSRTAWEHLTSAEVWGGWWSCAALQLQRRCRVTVLKAYTKMKPEDESSTAVALLVPSLTLLMAAGSLSSHSSKPAFSSAFVSVFPRTSRSIRRAGLTVPGCGNVEKLHLKSHHSRDFCLERTGTAVCHIYVHGLTALYAAKELQTHEGFLWQSPCKSENIPIHLLLSMSWPKAPPAAQASAKLLGKAFLFPQYPTRSHAQCSSPSHGAGSWVSRMPGQSERLFFSRSQVRSVSGGGRQADRGHCGQENNVQIRWEERRKILIFYSMKVFDPETTSLRTRKHFLFFKSAYFEVFIITIHPMYLH